MNTTKISDVSKVLIDFQNKQILKSNVKCYDVNSLNNLTLSPSLIYPLKEKYSKIIRQKTLETLPQSLKKNLYFTPLNTYHFSVNWFKKTYTELPMNIISKELDLCLVKNRIECNLFFPIIGPYSVYGCLDLEGEKCLIINRQLFAKTLTKIGIKTDKDDKHTLAFVTLARYLNPLSKANMRLLYPSLPVTSTKIELNEMIFCMGDKQLTQKSRETFFTWNMR